MNAKNKKSKQSINLNQQTKSKENSKKIKPFMTSYQQQGVIPPIECQCTCGTRISLDEQLLNQRQQWKSKYYCLQKQMTRDIGLLKEKIYQECSTLMHSEFLAKEKNHAAILNAKSTQIQQLTSRVIKLQTAWKISEKEKEVLIKRLEEEQKRYAEKLEQFSELKNNHIKKYTSLQQQNLTETGTLKLKISEDYEAKIQKLEKENEHLRHKISQFQKKYAAIIPEVQKLKNIINKKTAEVQGLQQQREKTKEAHAKEISTLKQKIEELSQLHAPCSNQITDLTHTISSLQSQLAKAKLMKKEVKVEPVYVDRPVEVERVVQKLIEVERIVKEYIQPSEDYRQLEEDNKKLKIQLESIVQELKLFENRYESTLHQHESVIRQFEENITKYKIERQSLVKRIHEQDEELEKIYNMINAQSQREYTLGGQPQRIVVQVNKDGTVNKRVEKIGIEERVKATVGKLPINVKDIELGKQTEQGRNLNSAQRAKRVSAVTQITGKKK